MDDITIQNKLLRSIQDAQELANFWLRNHSGLPESVLERAMERSFNALNGQLAHSVVAVGSIQLARETVSDHDWEHRIARVTGLSMIGLGQPILKKRFVTPGAAAGTSIASKYMAKAFPQKLPKRILGTVVLGRALGRATPIVGGAIIAIDAVETYFAKSAAGDSPGSVGGDFSGAGASGEW